jgi:hypothetical protein
MTDTIRIRAGLFRLLKQAMEDCAANIPASMEMTAVEVDRHTLTAMLVLLKFHPDEEAGSFYSDKILRLLTGKDQVIEEPKSRTPSPPVFNFVRKPSNSDDPYNTALDLILEYGKIIHEWKQKQNIDQGNENPA